MLMVIIECISRRHPTRQHHIVFNRISIYQFSFLITLSHVTDGLDAMLIELNIIANFVSVFSWMHLKREF